MKLWVMAGLISIAAAPAAFATEDTNAAAVSQRHVGAQTGVDPAMTSEARPQKDTVDVAPAAPAPPRTHARKHPRAVEAGVPDAVLIGNTGTL